MALSENARGALLMSASMASFTLNDTFMKSLSDHMPMFQVLFLRGVGAVLTMLVLAWWKGALHLRFPVRDKRLVAVRSVAEVGATILFMVALFNMPLANVSAIFQALPLAITLACAVFLREPVGWQRLAAILIGFGGVMLIVRPGGAGFNAYALAALGSVACVVVRDLVVRPMSGAVPSLVVALSAGAAVTVTAGVASLWDTWAMPSVAECGAMIGAMVFLVAGYLFSVSAMRWGSVTFVAPFRYTGLIWALLLGLVVFNDWPDLFTLAGAAIIVATGIFTLFRERRVKAGTGPVGAARRAAE